MIIFEPSANVGRAFEVKKIGLSGPVGQPADFQFTAGPDVDLFGNKSKVNRVMRRETIS